MTSHRCWFSWGLVIFNSVDYLVLRLASASCGCCACKIVTEGCTELQRNCPEDSFSAQNPFLEDGIIAEVSSFPLV